MTFDVFAGLPAGRVGEDERKLVEFTIGEVRYGVDIMNVREVVNPKATIPVPNSPSHFVGVTDHRQVAVPVVDLGVRLKVESTATASGKWIIVKHGGMDVARVVEAINGVIGVRSQERRELHPRVEDDQQIWVREAYGTNQGLIFELDLDRVIGAAEELDSGEAF